MSILSDKVLVLNRNCFPLQVVTVERALHLLFSDKALVMDEQWNAYSVEEWAVVAHDKLDRVVRTTNKIYIAPDVIKLTGYDKVLNRGLHLTRQNVFLRDAFSCGYCGSQKDLTIDHIIPKSKNGNNSWSNWVTCCRPCNGKKGDRTPEEAGMMLLVKPKRPSSIKFQLSRTWKDCWNVYLAET